jgi:hypothetical protein
MRPVDKYGSEVLDERTRELKAVTMRHRQSQAWMSPWYSAGRVDRTAAGGTGNRGDHTAVPTELSGAELEVMKLDALERVLISQLEDLRRSGAGQSRSATHSGSPPVATDTAERAIIGRILRIMARRATLLGLDAPRMREVAVISERQLVEAIHAMQMEIDALSAGEAEREARPTSGRSQPA